MITEDYVSFETAKLLKEKGFDGDIDLWYDENGKMFSHYKYDISCDWRVKAQLKVYLCPTLQMAMNWLETEYRFLFVIYHSIESGNLRFSWRIYQLQPDKCHYVENLKGIGDYYVDGKDCNSRKECCESAIKYCLENLI